MAIDYRETLVTYLRSNSTEAAAQELGITKAALSQRLSQMRKAGVKVPKKSNKQMLGEFEVSQLNSLIKKHTQPND